MHLKSTSLLLILSALLIFGTVTVFAVGCAKESLPDISHFATNKSDRFIVDFEDVIAAHPYPGQRSPRPHNDAQVYFSNTDERWQNAKRPSDYPPIYAVVDGIISIVDSYSLNAHTEYDPPSWHCVRSWPRGLS